MRESIDRFGEKKRFQRIFFVAVVTTKFFVTKISHALLHVKSTEIFWNFRRGSIIAKLEFSISYGVMHLNNNV